MILQCWLGKEDSLMWFRGKMEDRFVVRFRGMIGTETKDDKSIRILKMKVLSY